MPCVLPVLALKAFGLAELGGRSHREVAAHALGYVAGIEVTLLALAALVIALRAAGTYVGWGFQFQEPRFALAISLVLVGFALNLFGVFESARRPRSRASAGASGRRSFFDSLLAVVLAAPCRAFLWHHGGVRLRGLPAAIALIFAASDPNSRRRSQPSHSCRDRALRAALGPWMAKLRSALGFALLASACWTSGSSAARASARTPARCAPGCARARGLGLRPPSSGGAERAGPPARVCDRAGGAGRAAPALARALVARGGDTGR
jgi:thiol:disulfide interchange protein DsbD